MRPDLFVLTWLCFSLESPADLRLQKLEERRSLAPDLELQVGELCCSRVALLVLLRCPEDSVFPLFLLLQVVRNLTDVSPQTPYGSVVPTVSTTFVWCLSRKCRNKHVHISSGNTIAGGG